MFREEVKRSEAQGVPGTVGGVLGLGYGRPGVGVKSSKEISKLSNQGRMYPPKKTLGLGQRKSRKGGDKAKFQAG